MSAVISARGLTYAYSPATTGTVLSALDLELAPGEIVVVTGASGAGKTTLLTLCGALRSVQQGDLRVLGRDLRQLGGDAQRELRSSIGFVFQSHHLIDALSAGQNVVMSLMDRVSVAEAMARAETALTALGLAARIDALPSALSGGEKQRVAVARALVREPHLLLADEPTASLDDDSADIVKDAISLAAKRRSCAALVVTHDARLLDIADRVLRLVNGGLVDLRPRSGRSNLKWMSSIAGVEAP
ncbi:ABC transporter ATP-binding protein [Povalibacter sp.]|uniref:ABC transporter ATP-binding protein n=1 Tax=Povalibacter sp. TaxID=1962978 RepID=UPI002F3E8710